MNGLQQLIDKSGHVFDKPFKYKLPKRPRRPKGSIGRKAFLLANYKSMSFEDYKSYIEKYSLLTIPSDIKINFPCLRCGDRRWRVRKESTFCLNCNMNYHRLLREYQKVLGVRMPLKYLEMNYRHMSPDEYKKFILTYDIKVIPYEIKTSFPCVKCGEIEWEQDSKMIYCNPCSMSRLKILAQMEKQIKL